MSDSAAVRQSGSGIGLFGLMGVVFVVLKLTNVIDWSWWWVTAPFWGPWVLVVVFFVVIAGIALVLHARDRAAR